MDSRALRNSDLSETEKYAAAGLFCLAYVESLRNRFRCDQYQTEDTLRTNPDPWIEEEFPLCEHVLSFLKIDQVKQGTLRRLTYAEEVSNQARTFLHILANEERADPPNLVKAETELEKAVNAFLAKELERFASSSSKSALTVSSSNISEASVAVGDENGPGKIKSDDPGSETIPVESKIMDNELNDTAVFDSEFELSSRLKAAIIWDLLTACVADMTKNEKKKSRNLEKSGYDSRFRITMRLISYWINMDWKKVTAIESMVALSAYEAQKQMEKKEKEAMSASSENSMQRWKKNAIIGASAVGVGSLLALTGGLAAPAIIAGFSALGPTVGTVIPFGSAIIASSAAIAGSTIGSAAVVGAFGAAGAGLGGYKMAKRVADINEFYFIPISESGSVEQTLSISPSTSDNEESKKLKEKKESGKENDWDLELFFNPTSSNPKNVNSELKGVDRPRMAVEIVISGYVKSNKDFIFPWGRSKIDLETFALIYESDKLIALSTAIEDWLKSEITIQIIKRGAMFTVLSGLVSAMTFPLAFISATNLIDGKWGLAIDRSDKAGKLLAELLLNHTHGDRPVTLIGFSMGARVIWSCLNALVSSGHKGGIIERVVMLGAPVPAISPNWQDIRKIVSGRFVNGFSKSDWTLGLIHRATFLLSGTAGIQTVLCEGIENLDITHLVDRHGSYLTNLDNILNYVRIDSYFPTTPVVVEEAPTVVPQEASDVKEETLNGEHHDDDAFIFFIP